MISIKNVTFVRNQKQILHNVSWEVRKGEHWVILGLNGSGKTTLLNIINGYIWPTKGSVKVLNHTFGETYLPDLRKEIGWVSSHLQQKIHENISAFELVLGGKFAAIGLHEVVYDDDIEKAIGLMEMLGCIHVKDECYGILSQGERQRVLIARALMSEPSILILDEPCNGLDVIAREQLLQYIEKIGTEPNGPTLIFVTHHVEDILPIFTRSLLLKKGEVFAKGETKSLLSESTLSDFFECPVIVKQNNNRLWLSLKK